MATCISYPSSPTVDSCTVFVIKLGKKAMGYLASEDLAFQETPLKSTPHEEATAQVEDAIIVESHQGNGSGCNAGHQGWLSGLFLAILFPLLKLRRSS